MTGRYGQLTYTSFDKPGSAAGGWQIKQVGGALSADETQTLVSGVRTMLDPVEPLPNYPTPEELERGPRRLAYWRLDEGTAGYWHTVPAGADSTGRPGNIFAHAVLDRDPDAIPRHRPIQRWRAAQWLCPYGASAVARAMLPGEAPGPAEVVTRDSVIAFALDTSTWRLATLFGLLDAVAAALAGGAPVVLGVESADAAAQWIGLVSFLMSPGTAAWMNFSTFERPEQLPLARRSHQHLTAVPVADLAAVPAGVVAIDETATLSLGELGAEPHRTESGQPITVTAWSAMAQVVLLEQHSARRMLDDIDRYAAQTDDRGLQPAWPMAMAVAADGEFADAHAEAHSVIAAYSPRDVAIDSTAGRTISGVMAALVGTTTAEAWRAVQQAPWGPAAEHADLTYVCRAIADDTWLDQLGPIPVGPRPFQGTLVPPELSAAIEPALERARAVGSYQVVRLVDFLTRAGVDDERLVTALRCDVLGHLCDPESGPHLIHRLGQRIGAETRVALAAESLKATGHRDGIPGLTNDVLAWLAAGVSAPASSELARALPWDPTWNRAALRGALSQQVGPSNAADRCAWLWWLRICGSPRFEQMAAAAVWEPAELLAAAGGAPPGLSVLPTLVGAPDSTALTELASVVRDANSEDTAVACAAVRLLEPRIWLEDGHIETEQGAYTPHWNAVLEALGPERVHPDFAVRLLTLAMLGSIFDQPYPTACAALAADPGLGAAAVAQLVALVDDQVIVPAAVIAASLVRTGATEEDAEAAGNSSVEGLLAQAAQQLAAASEFSEQDVAEAASLMAQMSGIEPDGGVLRRNRKMVARLLARGTAAQPSLASRIRGSR